MTNDQEPTTYIALFHYRENAAAAIRDLEGAGFSSDALTIIGGSEAASRNTHGSFGAAYGYGGADRLGDIGVPDRDRAHLQDGLSKGGTVLVLEGAGDRAAEIEKIFHSHSTDKIDETGVEGSGYVAPALASVEPVVAADATVIPIVEESLVVGKREVDRGGVRVFKRIVEEPVTTSVNLHEEHVVVERHAVNRAAAESDLLRGDQLIELTEVGEEAVVGKTARVVEEVLIGKQAVERTETIHETVRHTEVETESTAADAVATPTKPRRS